MISLLFSVKLGFKDMGGVYLYICIFGFLGQSFCSSLIEPIGVEKMCNPLLEI